MLWGEPQKNFVECSLRRSYDLAAMKPDIQKSYPFIFDIHTTTPLPTDPLTVMQRPYCMAGPGYVYDPA